MLAPANAQHAKAALPLVKPGTNASLGPLKHIDAGILNVAYAEAGPADGPSVILLHGWPYDIHSFVDVTPMLASAGYRVLVPYLRGYGATRFLSSDAFRNGQPSALAVDVIAFMDALKIEKAVLAGFDWGARSADIVAALWPERVKALVAVSGYLIGSSAGSTNSLASTTPHKTHIGLILDNYFQHTPARACTNRQSCATYKVSRYHEDSSHMPKARLTKRLIDGLVSWAKRLTSVGILTCPASGAKSRQLARKFSSSNIGSAVEARVFVSTQSARTGW